MLNLLFYTQNARHHEYNFVFCTVNSRDTRVSTSMPNSRCQSKANKTRIQKKNINKSQITHELTMEQIIIRYALQNVCCWRFICYAREIVKCANRKHERCEYSALRYFIPWCVLHLTKATKQLIAGDAERLLINTRSTQQESRYAAFGRAMQAKLL